MPLLDFELLAIHISKKTMAPELCIKHPHLVKMITGFVWKIGLSINRKNHLVLLMQMGILLVRSIL